MHPEAEYVPSPAEIGRVLIKIDGKLDRIDARQSSMALDLNTVKLTHAARIKAVETAQRNQGRWVRALGVAALTAAASSVWNWLTSGKLPPAH